MLQPNEKNRENLANRQGLQEGITGSAAGNLPAPMTNFMAEMMMGAPQQPQGHAGAAAQAAGAVAQAAGADAATAEGAAAGDSASQASG